MTKQACDSGEIEITPAMLQAGVAELRENAILLLSGEHERLVETIFMSMWLSNP